MVADVLVESGFGLGDVRWVPAVAQRGLVAAQQDDGHLASIGGLAEGVEDPEYRRSIGVRRGFGRGSASECMHVVARCDDRVGFLAAFIIKVSSVDLECRQQCHHFPEDLPIGLGDLRQPPVEQRVVVEIHGMHSSSYEVERISGNLSGNQLSGSCRTQHHLPDRKLHETGYSGALQHQTDPMGPPTDQKVRGFESLRARH